MYEFLQRYRARNRTWRPERVTVTGVTGSPVVCFEVDSSDDVGVRLDGLTG